MRSAATRRTVQQDPPPEELGNFHCSAEWHLRRMRSTFASLLYPWARRLAKKSRVFSASTMQIAEYFSVNRSTVDRALEELVEIGLFKKTASGSFTPNTYKVVDHKEWAEAKPGRCTEKLAYSWSNGDSLGRDLFAISGQRVKFYVNQITGYRGLGFSDAEIEKLFRDFLETGALRGKKTPFDFHAFLKCRAAQKQHDRAAQKRIAVLHRSSTSSRYESCDREQTIPGSPSASGACAPAQSEKRQQPEPIPATGRVPKTPAQAPLQVSDSVFSKLVQNDARKSSVSGAVS